jgi:hypothetical protein
MNRKAPQPLQTLQINGKNVTVIQKGLNKPAVQIINRPAPPPKTKA